MVTPDKESLDSLGKTVEWLLVPDKQVILSVGPVLVRECRARDLGTVLKLFSFMMGRLGMTSFGQVAMLQEYLKDPMMMLGLFADSASLLWHTAASLCDLEEEAILNLPLDDAFALVKGIAEVNKIFFIRKVLPMLNVPFASPGQQDQPLPMPEDQANE